MIDDATLNQSLGRIALQDRAALRELYQAAGGRLLAVARRLLGDLATAEDVVQDTFVTVWTRAAQFPTLRASPMDWLTSINRHRAIELLRRQCPDIPLHWHNADGREYQHDVADASDSPPDQLLAADSVGNLYSRAPATDARWARTPLSC